MDYSKSIICGRLARDAELFPTTTNEDGSVKTRARLAFTVLCNIFRGKNNDKRLVSHRCTVWGDRANSYASMLKKGKEVLVEGTSLSYQTEGLKTSDGKDKIVTSHSIEVSEIQLGADGKAERDKRQVEAVVNNSAGVDAIAAKVMEMLQGKNQTEDTPAEAAEAPAEEVADPFKEGEAE